MDEKAVDDIEKISQAIQKSVKNSIISSNSISITDYSYYNSFPGFAKVMKHNSKSLLNIICSLIKSQKTGCKSFKKAQDIEDKFDALCDYNDIILDRINHALDEAEGIKKKDQELILATLNTSQKAMVCSVSDWNQGIKRKHDVVYNLLSAKTIHRPQSHFKDKIDNRSLPFVPIIKDKPNSIRPLAILVEVNEEGQECYCHPYETEIEKFQPSEDMLINVEPKKPLSINDTPLIYIDTKEGLEDLCKTLNSSKEFAVDLEHHSYRSFQGFTCLMQISTREKDFIIDTLVLRSEMNLLNVSFTHPSIVKVFHGADMDIIWLQRDFGIYVVNLFDTGQAAKLLNFAHYSLAYLLKYYCNLEVNKKFQLADWRIRPLSEEMLQYAREDTHYLLYIYDLMKNELIDNGNVNKNLIKSAFERSKQICLKRYERPMFNENGFLPLLKRSKANLNPRQMYALREIYSWRDKIARLEDESLNYILPNHMMLQISDVLPREQQGILACCNPIPPIVKQQLNELHQIILKARNLPIESKSSTTIGMPRKMNSNKTIDYDNLIHLRHDILYNGESQHLNTLLLDGTGDDIDYNEIAKKFKKNLKDPTSLVEVFENLKTSLKKQVLGSDILIKYSTKLINLPL